MASLGLPFMRLPAWRVFDGEERDQPDDDRHEAAEEHRAPTIGCADGVVERGGDEEAEIVSRLEIASAHLAPVFGPGFGDIGAGKRPFAADADAGEEPENPELPDI